MENRKYFLIVYKPSSVDTCRGCEMERYSDDYQEYADCSKEEIIKIVSDYASKHLGYGEAGYQFTLVYISEQNTLESVRDFYRPYVSSFTPHETTNDEKCIDRIRNLITARVEQILAERMKKIALEELQKKEESRRQDEAKERKKLSELLAKYPDAK